MMALFLSHPPDYIRTLSCILFLIFALLTFVGAFYNARSQSLMSSHLRRPKNFLNHTLNIFTARLKIEKEFEHHQRLQSLTSEELEISFQTHLIGQKKICHELAQYLHYFLHLSNHASPMNVFLFQGEKETGKTTLAKIIAQKLQFSLTIIEQNAPLSCFIDLQKIVKNHIILIKEITTISLEAQHLLIKIIEQNQKNIFILTHTLSPSHTESQTLPQILYKKINRDLSFNTLNEHDLSRIIAKNLEQKIQNAGFHIHNNIFPPALIEQMLQKLPQEMTKTSLRQKINYFENIINPSLITAQQQNAPSLSFYLENNQIKIESSKEFFRL